MDWNLAIEKNREALKRILAMLVAMAGLGDALASPQGQEIRGGRRSPDRRVGVIAAPQPPPDASRRPPHKGEVKPVLTLPRHLHRAILSLLRPAESAVRRLIIVMARGLVVTLPPVRPRKPKPAPTFLRKPGGTGILMPSKFRAPTISMAGAPRAPRALSLPLLDPLRPFRPRPKRPVQRSIPRISFPGFTAPSPIALRRPPAPDDPLDATRMALRLQALGAALDDLPRQAKRFARWRAARRDAVGAQNRNPDAAGAQNKNRQAGLARRVWPLRPSRPPGQRPARHRAEVHEVLADLHWFAFEVLEHPDTS
ncbi:hypothetical protein [Mesorhizobium sp. KR9-304]|uniref:hypothetical protein n=1 Tax=Mesorhizobium sp. KR9-304 TaxID=3156614 RepID=UPI0032B46D4D